MSEGVTLTLPYAFNFINTPEVVNEQSMMHSDE